MAKEKPSEFANFDRMMHELIKVPHSELKAKLEAEQREEQNADANFQPVLASIFLEDEVGYVLAKNANGNSDC